MTYVNEAAANELFLYATNDYRLYTTYVQPILKNFRRKVKNGTFNDKLAPKAFDSCAKDAAMRYCKEFCTPGQPYYHTFNAATRHEVSRMMYEFFADEL